MKKILFTIILITSVMLSSIAQIKGFVVSTDSAPIESANIVLIDADSAFVTGTITDRKGAFTLSGNIKPTSSYTLTVTCVGYESQSVHLKNIPAKIDLGNIALQSLQLEEVVVTAERSITKTDRRLIFPTEVDVKNSSNGYDLLNRIMIPGLMVDIVEKTISKAGAGSVPIYINEKQVTQADVIALRPDEIIRVEYIDNPGFEYNKADAVVNFVVKRKIAGIATGINTTNAFTTGNGNNFYYFRYNNKLSEYAVNYSMNYGIMNKRFINQKDVYTLPDETEHIIEREGISTYLKYAQQRVQLKYNLTNPEKYVFEVNFHGGFYDSPNRGHKQIINETGQPTYYSLTEPTEKNYAPVLDLNSKIYLPKNQTLRFNVVGTYIDTEYGYSYKTFDNNLFDTPIQHYWYNTQGERYSLIGDARYDKQFDSFRFVCGINHSEGYVENRYTGSDNVMNKFRDSKSTAFVQVYGNINKLNYYAGASAIRQMYDQEDTRVYWSWDANGGLSYSPFKGGNIRLGFNYLSVAPGLSSISNVRQQINSMEYKLGNPELKPYLNMLHALVLNYQHKHFYIENTTGYKYLKNPIMDKITRGVDGEGNPIFEFSQDNHKFANELWNYTFGQYYVIPKKLTLQGGISYLVHSSHGNNYTHNFDRFWGTVQANLTLNKWNFGMRWNSMERYFLGESETYRSRYSNLYANYKLNDMTFGVNLSYFLSKNEYRSGERTTNQYINKDLAVFIPDYDNMISFTFSWDINKGRRYQGENKSINHSDSDTGILKY